MKSQKERWKVDCWNSAELTWILYHGFRASSNLLFYETLVNFTT